MLFLDTSSNQPPTVGHFSCVYHFAIAHIILKNIIKHKSPLFLRITFLLNQITELVATHSMWVYIFKIFTLVLLQCFNLVLC